VVRTSVPCTVRLADPGAQAGSITAASIPGTSVRSARCAAHATCRRGRSCGPAMVYDTS
jgi:hypothetical protein